MKLRNSQDGFVPIIICLTVMVVISSITISFAQIMKREQTQSLDRQLNSQAFYAAESGINYVLNRGTPDTGDTCITRPIYSTIANGTVSNPCILVDYSPEELIFDEVNDNRPIVFNISNQLETLTVQWSDKARGTTWKGSAAPTNFPPVSQWPNGPGVIELMIYPINSDVLVQDGNDRLRVYYLYPTSSAVPGRGNFATADSGSIIQGSCDATGTPEHCTVVIDNLNTSAYDSYVVRLRSFYRSATLLMENQTAGVPTTIDGAQRIIDSSGLINGEVGKRTQVRQPARASYNFPLYPLEVSAGVCKLGVYEPGGTVYNSDPC